MSAIFDLEQAILRCWNVTDDIGEILDDLEKGHMEMTEAAEALRAYQKVYQRRFERCFGQFEDFCGEVRDLRLRITELEQGNNPDAKMAKSGRSKGKRAVDQ